MKKNQEIKGGTGIWSWAVLACALAILLASQAHADDIPDTYECERNCSDRYGIEFDYGGMPKVPSDSLRWGGYLKCKRDCDFPPIDDKSDFDAD